MGALFGSWFSGWLNIRPIPSFIRVYLIAFDICFEGKESSDHVRLQITDYIDSVVLIRKIEKIYFMFPYVFIHGFHCKVIHFKYFLNAKHFHFRMLRLQISAQYKMQY